MNSLSIHEGVVKISIAVFHFDCDMHNNLKKNQNKCWIAIPVKLAVSSLKRWDI